MTIIALLKLLGTNIRPQQQIKLTEIDAKRVLRDIETLSHPAKKYDSWRIGRVRYVDSSSTQSDNFISISVSFYAWLDILSVELKYRVSQTSLMIRYRLGPMFYISNLYFVGLICLMLLANLNVFGVLISLTAIIPNWYFLLRSYVRDIMDLQNDIDELIKN